VIGTNDLIAGLEEGEHGQPTFTYIPTMFALSEADRSG
jgi:hypothetical protein